MLARNAAVLPAVLLALSLARGVEAAPTAKPAQADRALDLFEQSARAYREGRFDDAVEKLLEARRIKPEPVLMYNLARAYEALGRLEEAADAYAQYLVEEPAAGDRRAIEARIGTLRAQAAELAAARKVDPAAAEPRPPPPAPPPAPAPPPPRADGLAVVPWLALGAGAALAGTGAVLALVAADRHDDAVAEPAQRPASLKQEDAERLAGAATITVIAGAIVAVAGAGWLLVRALDGSGRRDGGQRARAPGWAWAF